MPTTSLRKNRASPSHEQKLRSNSAQQLLHHRDVASGGSRRFRRFGGGFFSLSSLRRWIVIVGIALVLVILLHYERSKLLQNSLSTEEDDGSGDHSNNNNLRSAGRDTVALGKVVAKRKNPLKEGAHIWVVTEHEGGTLGKQTASSQGRWEVIFDSGHVGQHAADDEAGEPNIVPFLSERQRNMKNRMKQLLQAEKDAETAKKAKVKDKVRARKNRKKERAKDKKSSARASAIEKKNRKKDRMKAKRVADKQKEKLRAFTKRNRTREKLILQRKAKNARDRQKAKDQLKRLIQRNKTREATRIINQRLAQKNRTKQKRIRERKRQRKKDLRREQLENLGELLPEEADNVVFGGDDWYYDAGPQNAQQLLSMFDDDNLGELFDDDDDDDYASHAIDDLFQDDYGSYYGSSQNDGEFAGAYSSDNEFIDEDLEFIDNYGTADEAGALNDAYSIWVDEMRRAMKAKQGTKATPVNVLFLVADGIGFDAYHALDDELSDEQLPTSALHKLAREGIQFREATAHTPSSMPSRAALYTGCTGFSSGFMTSRMLSPSNAQADSQCTPLLSTLEQLDYQTSYIDAAAAQLFGATTSGVTTRKQIRLAIASSNQEYWDWLAEMEPRVEEPDFFDSVGPTKSGSTNKQKTGTVKFGKKINVPYAQVVEMPADLLEAISRDSSMPSMMDYAEDRLAAAEVEGDREEEALPAWALFGTTSLPPHLSRSAFIANQTVQQLRRHAKHGMPFAVVASFVNPATPWLVSGQSYNGLFAALDDGVASLPSMPAGGADLDQHYPSGLQGPSDKSLSKRVRTFVSKNPMRYKYLTALYYTQVKEQNDAIGQILKVLERLNLADSTLVVVTSTSGTSLGRHGVLLRESLFDESLHVPLILRHPALLPQKMKVKVPVSSIDVTPTILELVSGGGSVEPYSGYTYGCDGMSLLPLVEGTTDGNTRPAKMDRLTVSSGSESLFAVRSKAYKLVWNSNQNPAKLFSDSQSDGEIAAALFDLKADPEEMHNVIADPMVQEVAKRLLSALQDYWTYVGYKPPTTEGD